MKKQLNEVKRMQKLAGILKENEGQNIEQAVDKVEARVEDAIENKVAKLDDNQVEELKAALAQMGIDANTTGEEAAEKIQGQLSEAEGEDPNKKMVDVLRTTGSGLLVSTLVPIIPLAIGSLTGMGFSGGLGIVAATSGILIALAKILEDRARKS